MAERLHALVKASAPGLASRTWYGMPAYTKDGKVVCFFQSAQKFKARYATLGFADKASPSASERSALLAGDRGAKVLAGDQLEVAAGEGERPEGLDVGPGRGGIGVGAVVGAEDDPVGADLADLGDQLVGLGAAAGDRRALVGEVAVDVGVAMAELGDLLPGRPVAPRRR